MSRLFYLRKLDFLLRIYWLNHGKIDKLNMAGNLYHPEGCLSLNSYKDYIKKLHIDLLVTPKIYFDSNDMKLCCSCLPITKLNRLFRRVVLTLVCRDSRIKLNAKSLKKLQQYYGIKSLNDYFGEAGQGLAILEMVQKYEISQLHEHITWAFFYTANSEILEAVQQRFKPKNIIPELFSLLEGLEIEDVVIKALSLELPETSRLIKSFYNK